MKLFILPLLFLATSLYGAELDENKQHVEILTLEQFLPDHDATPYVKEYNSMMTLDLSPEYIEEISGRKIVLTSLEGIEKLYARRYMNPCETVQASDFHSLWLPNHALKSLPEVMNNFKTVILNLENNKFTYIPSIVSSLIKSNLHTLNLSNNDIHGGFSEDLLLYVKSHPVKLRDLNLTKNNNLDRNQIGKTIEYIH